MMPVRRGFAALSLLLISAIVAAAPACSRKPPSFEKQRAEMVRQQLKQRGIRDPALLSAFGIVPREEFVLPRHRKHAYRDLEAPVGFGQTLDRPYENAVMIRALKIDPDDRVLEIGTGVGYLSSLVSRIAKEVFTIEIEPEIAVAAREHIANLGYTNIQVKTGDGFIGWPEHAPFDAIVLAASPPRVPEPLKEQLAEGGRLLAPIGGAERFQELVLFTKKDGKFVEIRRLAPTTFVPMKGKILENE